MALKQMKPGRKKEKAGAASKVSYLHKGPLDPTPGTGPIEEDGQSYVVLTHDSHGNLVTDPATIPRG